MKPLGRVGERVRRNRDQANGVIVHRFIAVPAFAHPGVFGKTVVEIRLDDEAKRRAAGGHMTGDLGWLRSNFAAIDRAEVRA